MHYHGKEIKTCIEEGITPHVPKPLPSASRKHGLFNKEDFRYDLEKDCYWCPVGEKLTFRFQTSAKNRDIKYYASKACSQCPSMAQCTRSKGGRRITRWLDKVLLDEMRRRVSNDPEKPVLPALSGAEGTIVEGMKLRTMLAEHRSSRLIGSFRNHQAPLGAGAFPDPQTFQGKG